ncbi:hypothetical protein GCM10010992_07910 [Cloacibacterium rupense]|uniref:Prevent-host-death protein n=1 Tax=Cloacibacterium rupense TaxID=517423 RepID=A0ABQ2NI37_9FLAO|nr:prevent-host-death protein [Cloacibacterium rupense]GGP02635.1 hypothetical protein GCM10010992_07910 [Cloacibacterium rupense]
MNYKIELNMQERGSDLVYNNILFDFFKVNIVERLTKKKTVSFVIFKVRTLNNELINTKDGHGRVKLKEDAFLKYNQLIKVLNSYEYEKKLINRKNAEQEFVDFILGLVVSNYNMN